MKRILVPIDGSEGSMKAIEKAKEFAKIFNSDITLLHIREILVAESHLHQLEELLKIIKEKSEKILDESKEFFSDIGGNIDTLSLDGIPGREIINYVEENDIDLVVMGSEGLGAGAIKRILIGSVANKVIHGISKPILIVK